MYYLYYLCEFHTWFVQLIGMTKSLSNSHALIATVDCDRHAKGWGKHACRLSQKMLNDGTIIGEVCHLLVDWEGQLSRTLANH